jgi:signal transduction histidine kinase
MYPDRRLRRLRSQLVFTFLISSLGIGIAIGVPVILLINRQASSQAQLLLAQATLTTQAFLVSERSDLQNLALLTSQRPTLIRLLEEQDFVALEDYLNTLREGAGLDLILVCSEGQELDGSGENIPMSEFCQTGSQTGYTAPTTSDELYLYTMANLEATRLPYRVVVGKRVSLILAELQKEAGLLYFLVWRNQVILASDPSVELTPALAAALQNQVGQTPRSSLSGRALELNTHRYILENLTIDDAMNIHLINALNVDNQLAIQQGLTRTLILALLLIILVAFGLGVWQSQRISRPIVDLAAAAGKFRQGDLEAPVSIQASVLEISQLANTLEDARITLQHSMEQLQAEKAWIEHLLNSIVEGTLTLDAQNRITFASTGVGKIIERDHDQIVGLKVDDVFLSTEGETVFSNQLPSAGQQRRVSIKLANGQERLLSISKANLIPPVASDATRALVIRDVTNEEYIHRFMGDFMSNITHEFRTPLAALEASSELLLDNLHSLSPKEIEELLISLNLGIINLQTLIDNLIEAASIEAGRFKVSIQPVSLDVILKEAQAVMQPLIERYDLRLEASPVTEPIVVLADQRRTIQILVNLLSNAIKYSPPHGLIKIKHAVVDHQLRMEVVDEGRGVPVEQRNTLFRRFSNINTPNQRSKQGIGLGLSVVKAIVEAQQGEVGILDSSEGGNSFWFTLPLADGSS